MRKTVVFARVNLVLLPRGWRTREQLHYIIICIQKNLTLLNVDVNRKRFINRGKPVNNIITLKVES
jgi:hypothetical protein